VLKRRFNVVAVTSRSWVIALTFVALAFSTVGVSQANAGTLVLLSCAGAQGFDDFGFPDGGTWTFGATPDVTSFEQSTACNAGRSFKIIGSAIARLGQHGQWSTTSPAQITMTGGLTLANSVLVNPDALLRDYVFRYVYAGGSTQITAGNSCCGGMSYAPQFSKSFSGHSFAIKVTCDNSNGCNPPSNSDLIDIPAIEISATDTTPPSLAATGAGNIWNEKSAWIRGAWPMPFQGSAEDGVCHLLAVVGGVAIGGQTVTPDDHVWMQCRDPLTWDAVVDTTEYANGPLPLKLYASDAASPANVASDGRTVQVDNTPVSLSLSGPTDWLSTAGAATIKATATAGPSGLAGVWCSVDNSPYQRYSGATASIPISGLGAHHVSCQAANNAVDSSGAPGRSPVDTWSLNIRQPSVSTVSFTTIADALKCHRTAERVHIPARWVTVRVHGQKVRVKEPAQSRVVEVTHCKPRIIRRRVRYAGHWYTETVVVLPHRVKRTAVRAAYGSRVAINGWLGTTAGNALGDRTVTILGAPTLPGAGFETVATAVTLTNGYWKAVVPAGPSRNLKVVYGGSGTVEPATSEQVHVTVPASIRLGLSAHATEWGHTIEIGGRLRGGFVPSDGELVTLHIGWSGGSAEIGQVYARRHGRFRTPYTFLRGTGSQSYRIWATTVRESDYPYAPGTSSPATITVRSP
jgi:hypothetical protein